MLAVPPFHPYCKKVRKIALSKKIQKISKTADF